MGPTVTRPVQDPLAVLLLDNRLYLSPDSNIKICKQYTLKFFQWGPSRALTGGGLFWFLSIYFYRIRKIVSQFLSFCYNYISCLYGSVKPLLSNEALQIKYFFLIHTGETLWFKASVPSFICHYCFVFQTTISGMTAMPFFWRGERFHQNN